MWKILPLSLYLTLSLPLRLNSQKTVLCSSYRRERDTQLECRYPYEIDIWPFQCVCTNVSGTSHFATVINDSQSSLTRVLLKSNAIVIVFAISFRCKCEKCPLYFRLSAKVILAKSHLTKSTSNKSSSWLAVAAISRTTYFG